LIRFVSVAGVALLALVCFELYNGVSRAKDQERELAALKAQVAREHEAIRVLKAEWSYLNQPERLQTLAREHLSLAPTGASQIVVLASLPLKNTPTNTPRVVEANELPAKVVPSAPKPRFKPELPKAVP
jgi:cell division protein FtsL